MRYYSLTTDTHNSQLTTHNFATEAGFDTIEEHAEKVKRGQWDPRKTPGRPKQV